MCIGDLWLQVWLKNCCKNTGYYSIFQLSLLLLLNNYQYNCNNTISSVSAPLRNTSVTLHFSEQIKIYPGNVQYPLLLLHESICHFDIKSCNPISLSRSLLLSCTSPVPLTYTCNRLCDKFVVILVHLRIGFSDLNADLYDKCFYIESAICLCV